MTKSIQTVGILLVTSLIASASWGRGPTPVIVVDIETTEMVDKVEALGTLLANESVTISSTVTELVNTVSFEDGQFIQKGEIIIEMDAAEEFALMVEEESRLRQAERQLERTEELIASGAVSESVHDEAIRDYNAAKARIAAIKSRIDRRVLRAPFDGITGLRAISPGALVQPGTVITTIDDTSSMKLDFSVPSVFLKTLEVGLPVEAHSSAFPNQKFVGNIHGIDSRIDPVTRSVMVRAILPNENGLLRTGLLLQVQLRKNERQAITIPEEAITQDGTDTFVWRITNSAEGGTTAARTKIELGPRIRGEVEVLSGLSVGDQVVTHGIDRIRPGSPVKVVAIDDGSTPISEILPKLATAAQN